MPSKRPIRRSSLSPRDRALKNLKNGNQRDALAWAETARNSSDVENLTAAAQIFQASNDPDNVLAIYQQLSSLQPTERLWKVAIACALALKSDEKRLEQHLVDSGIEPLIAAELSLIASAAADSGHHHLSVKFYRRACKDAISKDNDEQYAEAVIPLAAALKQIGETNEAIELLKSLVESKTKDPALTARAWFNLGVMLETNDPSAAVAAYQNSLEILPTYELPVANLAILLTRMGNLDDAISLLTPLVVNDVDIPRSAVLLASASRLNGQPELAIETLERVLSKNSGAEKSELAREMLVRILIETGESSSAIEKCEAWLKQDPESSIATHMLAAIQGENVPNRASADYVAKTFDSFADSFDAVLNNLEYRAPQLVGHLAAQSLGEANADKRVLDAGCGTGLVGPILRPFANELVGVDLSKNMLAHAHSRNCYDSLIRSDLLVYLKDVPTNRPFDVIVAADTFNYFGDLSELIPSCFAALADDGWLIFTLELGETYGETYQLEAHGRYSHPPSYLMDQLGQCGIEGGEMHRVVLRKENGVDVVGLLVAAQKPNLEN
jgi:predicted TPR repeat methyltransferase